MMESFDALVLGGGAAGLMCAIEAGRRGRRVAVLERSERVGKKILISGGGRCNFTNLHCGPENFISANPHFARSALARYTPEEFIALVRKHGIRYHEKTLGQLFCDGSAREIVAMLERECEQAGVKICVNLNIDAIERSDRFLVSAGKEQFAAAALVVATGGLSIPKIGATSIGYELARQFGLAVRETRPGLVPLLFGEKDRSSYGDLAGMSMEVVAECGSERFREKMLVTHRGWSGPAILQASSYWANSKPVRIDLAPEQEVTAAFRNPKTPRTAATLKAELRKFLPQRFADRWLEVNMPAALTNAALVNFEKKIHTWEIVPSGTEGYEKAEVTAGGVDTSELSDKTMESRKVPGLYFIGEVVDVTGQLGGFNFQWAWASGAAAGRSI